MLFGEPEELPRRGWSWEAQRTARRLTELPPDLLQRSHELVDGVGEFAISVSLGALRRSSVGTPATALVTSVVCLWRGIPAGVWTAITVSVRVGLPVVYPIAVVPFAVVYPIAVVPVEILLVTVVPVAFFHGPSRGAVAKTLRHDRVRLTLTTSDAHRTFMQGHPFFSVRTK